MDYSDRSLLRLISERATMANDAWAVPCDIMRLVHQRLKWKPRAVEAHKAKRRLSDDDIRALRNLYECGDGTCKSLADRFGVSNGAVHAIVTRRTYKDVS